MSHSRPRSMKGYGMWFIRKPFDLEVGDWVLSHGDGRTTYPAKIILIDDKEVILSGGHKLNKTGLLARIESGNVNNAPNGVLVEDVKAALKDYGRLRVETWSDYARGLHKHKEDRE